MMGFEDCFKRYDLSKQITASTDNIVGLFYSRVSTTLCRRLKVWFLWYMILDLYLQVRSKAA